MPSDDTDWGVSFFIGKDKMKAFWTITAILMAPVYLLQIGFKDLDIKYPNLRMLAKLGGKILITLIIWSVYSFKDALIIWILLEILTYQEHLFKLFSYLSRVSMLKTNQEQDKTLKAVSRVNEIDLDTMSVDEYNDYYRDLAEIVGAKIWFRGNNYKILESMSIKNMATKLFKLHDEEVINFAIKN